MTAAKVHAGTLEALSQKGAILVSLERRAGRPRQAIVVLDDAKIPHAYLNECRHVPVPLDGGTGHVLDHTKRFLVCGTHGALYERKSGLCVTGPCRGARLFALTVTVEGDLLYVDDPL